MALPKEGTASCFLQIKIENRLLIAFQMKPACYTFSHDDDSYTSGIPQVVASAEEVVFALTMLPLAIMVGLGLFRVDWGAVVTPPAMGDVDWRLFIQIMFWTSTYWQKVVYEAFLVMAGGGDELAVQCSLHVWCLFEHV